MILLPYKLDVRLYNIPVVTALVCVICLVTFMSQESSNLNFDKSLTAYCTQLDPSLREIVDQIDDERIGGGCENVFMGIRRSGNRDQEISILAAEVPNLVFFPDKEQDRKYKVAVLTRGVEHFDTLVPNELTNKLAYSSDHYDFVAMITSTFAHASWEHLLGNLFFFFVFGSCVECVLGSFQFSLCFIVMAITTSVAFSFSVAGGSAIQTIGLSGVAMGMMAMLTALLPKANIWCFFWFFFWIRRFTLPVLAITAWFVCWNVFDLYFDHSSHINYMAHVSGAITGVALGICYRVFAPKKLEEAVVSA